MCNHSVIDRSNSCQHVSCGPLTSVLYGMDVMDCNVKPSLAAGFRMPRGAPQGENTKGTLVKGHLCAYLKGKSFIHSLVRHISSSRVWVSLAVGFRKFNLEIGTPHCEFWTSKGQFEVKTSNDRESPSSLSNCVCVEQVRLNVWPSWIELGGLCVQNPADSRQHRFNN